MGARWWALGLVVTAEFVVFLDIAIVNIALPTMADELELGRAQVGLVVNAYQVVFGGLLLLGGRLADAVGRTRVFLTGFGVFTAASLAGGLAGSGEALVAARALQGLGAALLVPSITALIVAMFTQERERRRAFGIWGAMRAGGASSGAALGGVITQTLGWEWIFLINVPIGLCVLIAGPILLPRLARDPTARPSALAAITGTGGLLLLSAAVAGGPASGWLGTPTVVSAVTALVLLGLFAVAEGRAAQPLVPRRVLNPTVIATTVASLFYGASHIPLFLFLSFYLQGSLGHSPLVAGVALLPIGVLVMAASSLAVPQALERLGARNTLGAGLGLLAVSLVLLARAPQDGTYLFDVLPAGVLAALGLAACFTSLTLPAVTAVADSDTGTASGLVNSAQRIGSGLGVAVLVTLPAAGPNLQSLPFLAAAALAALGLITAVSMLPAEVPSVRPVRWVGRR